MERLRQVVPRDGQVANPASRAVHHDQLVGGGQLLEDLPPVTVLEERPVTAALSAVELLIDGGVQVDDEAAASEVIAILGQQHSTGKVSFGATIAPHSYRVFRTRST